MKRSPTDKPRIGINCCPLRPEGGGARYFFFGLLSGLLRAPESPYRYLLFADPKARALIEPFLAERAGERNASDFEVVPVASEWEISPHESRFEILFGPLNNLNPRLYDRPSLGMILDIQEQYFPEYFTRKQLLSRYEAYPDIARASTVCLTISEFCKSTIVEKFGIDPERVDVLYLAAQEGLAGTRAEGRAKWMKPEKLPEDFLFYPANTYAHKNHAFLLDALVREPALKDEKVVFSGHEVGFPLRAEIARRGLSDRCFVFTELGLEEMAYLFQNAFATLMPTRFEGFGIPALEALGCGSPLICSDLPVLREIAGEAALYFVPTDPAALAAAVARARSESSSERDARIARGRVEAARFGWKRSAGQFLASVEKARARFRAEGEAKGGAAEWVWLRAPSGRDAARARALATLGSVSDKIDVIVGEILEAGPGGSVRSARVRVHGDGTWRIDWGLYPEAILVRARALKEFEGQPLWGAFARGKAQGRVLIAPIVFGRRGPGAASAQALAFFQGQFLLHSPQGSLLGFKAQTRFILGWAAGRARAFVPGPVRRLAKKLLLRR